MSFGKSPVSQFERVNKELWVILSMFVIALVLNYVVASQRMVLTLYVLPTLVSAYLYGKRHATLTAVGSVLLVVLITLLGSYAGTDGLFRSTHEVALPYDQWIDLTVWGGTLIIIGYLTGSLYDHKMAQIRELRETYNGVLMLLRHFISQDQFTESHCHRVSLYAVRLAQMMRLNADRIEDVRAAALLHDIGKLEISRNLLYKAARLTKDEYAHVQEHVPRGAAIMESVGGSLRRVIPIILAHHDKFDGTGYRPTKGEDIPLEARIISVADVYDSLASDRPYRKAMSPFEVRDIIVNGAGKEFDPQVVQAFETAFTRGDLDMSSAALSAA